MRTPWRTLAIGVAALVLISMTAACSSDDGDAARGASTSTTSPSTTEPSTTTTVPAVVKAAAPIPVSADALPAGTDLGNGFTVPEGAVLLGPPTPIDDGYTYNGVDVADRGWDATMVVLGDPRDVVAQLREQAEAAGMELHPGDEHEGAMEADSFCGEADRGYVCAARGSRGTGNGADYLDVELVRRDPRAGSPPVSHLWLRYSDSDRPSLTPFTSDPDLPLGPEPPPVPSDWDALPAAGERVLTGVLPDDFPGIEVVEGTRIVGPAADPQGYAGYDVHVAIDDPTDPPASTDATPKDPNDQSETPAQAVAFAYAQRALEGLGGVELFWGDSWSTPDGTLVRRVSIDEAGGFKFDFVTVEPTDGPATLTITTGYD